MNLTQKQKVYVALALAVLAALGYVTHTYVMPQLQIYRQTANEVKAARAELEAAKQRFYYYPDPAEVINQLNNLKGAWQQELDRAKRVYNTTECKVPDGVAFPGYYFRDEYERVREEVLKKARDKGVPIPDNIGFGGGIPDDDMVELMLNQLNNAKFILELLIDSGATEVSGFVVGQPVEEKGFLQILPYQVSILISTENLVRLLDRIKTTTQYLSVRSLGIRKEMTPQGTTLLRVDMVLFTTRLLDKPVIVAQAAPQPGLATGMPGGMGPMRRFMMMRRGAGAAPGQGLPPAPGQAQVQGQSGS